VEDTENAIRNHRGLKFTEPEVFAIRNTDIEKLFPFVWSLPEITVSAPDGRRIS
jgi:hypothetical protein